MTTAGVVDFSDQPKSTSERYLSELPDRVVAGNPHHTTEVRFESPDKKLLAGTWTSTPGKWHAFTERDEYCYIVSGHVRLVDKTGNAQVFKTGDSFLIPDGFDGFWDVIETTTKQFVIRLCDD
ncbi:MAG: cupin domain-containing protein [Stappiaceae bacterium]